MNVFGEDIKHLVKQKSVFLLVQNFWKVLFPEEELPDLIENVLAEAIGFWAILCNKR